MSRFDVRSWRLNGLDGWGVYDTLEDRFVGGWFAEHIRFAAEAMVRHHEREGSGLILCAHADQNGEGAHWRHESQPCTVGEAHRA